MNPALAHAVEVQTAWKSAEIVSASIALVQAGLKELDKGRTYFGPDNIPEHISFSGVGIVGSAVHMLREAHIIQDCMIHRPEDGIVAGRRRSLRPSANGRKICLYSLTSRGMAEAFLQRHNVPMILRQAELF